MCCTCWTVSAEHLLSRVAELPAHKQGIAGGFCKLLLLLCSLNMLYMLLYMLLDGCVVYMLFFRLLYNAVAFVAIRPVSLCFTPGCMRLKLRLGMSTGEPTHFPTTCGYQN